MNYHVIEPDGTTSYVLFKGRSVGMTTSLGAEYLESLKGKLPDITTALQYINAMGEEYHKRLPDGSTQKLASRHKELAFHEAGIIEEKKMNEALKESVEELVLAVTDEFLQEKELRRKARNKRKAAKRKGKK